jgi:hypothetical protein
MLIVLFGVLALALAVVGIYGVTNYAVARRTQEIGLRLALSAQQSDVLRGVLIRGMQPVVVGLGRRSRGRENRRGGSAKCSVWRRAARSGGVWRRVRRPARCRTDRVVHACTPRNKSRSARRAPVRVENHDRHARGLSASGFGGMVTLSCHQPCVASACAGRRHEKWSPSKADASEALVAVWEPTCPPRTIEQRLLLRLWPLRQPPVRRPSRDSNACICGPSRNDRAGCAPVVDW